MITLSGTTYELSDPIVLLVLAGAFVLLVVVILLIISVRRAGQSALLTQHLASQMGGLGSRVNELSNGQQQLFGGLNSVSEAQAQQQAQTLQLMEQRLAQVNEAMGQNLSASAQRTAQSLGELQQRLQTEQTGASESAMDEQVSFKDKIQSVI